MYPWTLQAARWPKALMALLVVLFAIAFAYRDTARTMVQLWWEIETYSHAFLVLPIALWLIWRRREALAATVLQPDARLLIPMAALGFAWVLGELVAVNALTQFTMVGLFVLAVPAVLGVDVARRIQFPLLFLFFAVPFGEFMQPPMMVWTADFTVGALRLSGIPVFREGLHFVIPSGRWSVIETCSGTRYLIASFMVGTLFAYLNYRSMRRRWIFIGFSLLMPIVANWVRAYLVVMLAHLTDNRLAVGVDHLIYGWVFFGVVIFIMFALGARWAEADAQSESSTDTAASAARAAPATGNVFTGRHAAVCLATLLVTLAPHAVIALIERGESTAAPTFAKLDFGPKGWVISPDAPQIKPVFQNPPVVVAQEYDNGPLRVGMYLAYYRKQDYERKLVSSQNRVIQSDNPRWHRVQGGVQREQIVDQHVEFESTVYTEHAALGLSTRKLLVLQTFWVDGHWVANPVQAKVYGALGRLIGRGDDGAALVLYASGSDPDALARQMSQFVRDAGPELLRSLQDTSRRR